MNCKSLPGNVKQMRRIMVNDTKDTKYKLQKSKNNDQSNKENEFSNANIQEKVESGNSKNTVSQKSEPKVQKENSENNTKVVENKDKKESKEPEKRYEDYFKTKSSKDSNVEASTEFLKLKNVDGNFGRSLKGEIDEDVKVPSKSVQNTNNTDNEKKVTFQILQTEDSLLKRFRPTHRKVLATAVKSILKYSESF